MQALWKTVHREALTSGKQTAQALGVELWDRDVLSAMLRASARREGMQIS